jgi:hypothetical protein
MKLAFAQPCRRQETNNIRLRRTNRISWMISGWIMPAELGPDDGGTTSLTIGCPDDFYAVRLGFANATPDMWKISRIIGRASASFGDYANPTGAGNWLPFTFTGKGVDDRRIVSAPDAPTEIRVFAHHQGKSAGALTWTWTDWVPLSNGARDPASGMRVLMLRALVPSAQKICFANSRLSSFTGNTALNHGFDCFIGGLKFNYDRVSDPDTSINESAESWRDNALVNGSLFPIVQFLTKNAGIVGATTGDSHHQGTSTTEQMANYLYRATTVLGRDHIGTTPFGMVNCAFSGGRSWEFFPRFEDLLAAVRPSYAVLPGWTYNDNPGLDEGAVNSAEYLARLIMAIEQCRDADILPIVLTPFPRNIEAMSPPQLDAWRWLRRALSELKPADAITLDAAALLGATMDSELTGTYLPDLSDDGAHPNDVGHSLIADRLVSLLRSSCGAAAFT